MQCEGIAVGGLHPAKKCSDASAVRPFSCSDPMPESNRRSDIGGCTEPLESRALNILFDKGLGDAVPCTSPVSPSPGPNTLTITPKGATFFGHGWCECDNAGFGCSIDRNIGNPLSSEKIDAASVAPFDHGRSNSLDHVHLPVQINLNIHVPVCSGHLGERYLR